MECSGLKVLTEGRKCLENVKYLLYMYSRRNMMLALRLPLDVEERLDRLAKRSGRTKTHYAREAILRHLEDLEDAFEAESAVKEFYKSGEKSVPLAEVKKRLGMDT
jgi:RHH-type transcriptional regulator, rel operon repressor / antitoxin RelB